jgi:replicative DNA helicase
MKEQTDKRKQARESLYDLISEESLISHACANPKILADNHTAIETLTAERKTLAKAIYDMASASEPITEESLRLRGHAEDIRNLFAKLSCMMQSSSPEAVIARLRDVSARREVATAAADAYSEAIGGGKTALETIEAIEIASSKARHLLQGHETSGGVSHVGDIASLIDDIAWRAKNPGKIKGMSFGMMRLERLLDGLQSSKLYLIGARPSVGKTAFAGDIAIDLVQEGNGVMFFSCEMSKLQLQQRLLASKTGINPQKSLDGAYTKHDLEKIRSGMKEMRNWNLWIDDTDRIDIELLSSRARRAVAKDGVKCIIVDYIQLIRGVEPKSRTSKKEEVGEVSGKLKALSKELSVPIIALAQLKRSGNAYNSSSASTEIPKPNLESLKESGDLEQDADAVILLHRDMSKNASVAYAIIAKNRSGSNGEVELIFSNDTTSFTENPIR